jgi:mRNA-degrading endonuclease toxin of MazEF toxin-antitoxin module
VKRGRWGEPPVSTDLLVVEADPDFKGTGLKRASVIKLDKLFTLQKGLIVGKLGELSPPLMANVDERLRSALGLP